MTQPSDKYIEEFRKIYKKEYGKEISFEEARESATRLVNFVSLLIEIDQKERKLTARLKTEPKGFAIQGNGRTCPLCKTNVRDDMWFDKWGAKCLDCQDALNRKLIPGYVFKDHDNDKHITASELSWRHKLHNQTIKKLIKENKLKARTIPKSNTLVFLRKENPDLPTIIKEHQKNPV